MLFAAGNLEENLAGSLQINEKEAKQFRNYHARGNNYISNSWRFFDLYVFVLNSNSLTKNIFHVCHIMCIRICYKVNSAKSARYVYHIQNRWCSEVFTYVYVY